MPSAKNSDVFKSWVPDWLILVGIFLFLFPIASVLGIYMAGINSAASYYGIDAIDVRLSVVIFYLAIVCAFPIEKHFFNRFSSRPYLVGCALIYVAINLILYSTSSFAVLLILRFLGGVLSLSFIGISFSMIFRQFHAQRSRVLGYATLYSSLFATAPLAQILDAYVFTEYDFNTIFLVKIYALIPGLLLFLFLLKPKIDLRPEGKIPFKNVDWKSFVLLATPLILIAYILLYGQYYHWFKSIRITFCMIAFVFFTMLFVIRQLKLKEPYIDLGVFKTRNFRIGMLLLIAFYFAKGDTSALYGFFGNSVNLDMYNQGYVMLINAVGIIVGAALSARFILAKMNIRLIWITGFGALLAYHLLSLNVLANQAEMSDLLLPLFLQGFGNGSLILSIVMFYVTAVPPNIGFSASVTGVAFRFFTFTASMALVSFMSLHQQKVHQQSFAEHLTADNPIAMQHIAEYSQALQQEGNLFESPNASNALLSREVAKQTNLMFVRDYFIYMSVFIVLVMLAIALIPHFHYHIRKIGAKLIPV
ncbi:MFS transporter [Zunongwangia sp. SCSIO 43204]|uniref:MFS transporter n=1 Tax=Zunongwangia sp. SCSIO 43204 TaxID=2779359 RepID=UPI001CA8D367|nr:MFS transporter [Zunongwangia sp. SCSIO 43204]UAB85142.1 MFS transporter [Zunongwangia sp. SCSIO 43204]